MTARVLRARGLTVTVAPERGGAITSIVAAGREWLAQPAAGAGWQPASTVFTEGAMAGWDECAPSIDACLVDGVSVPDHGDLWARPWSVLDESASHLTLTVVSHGLGFRLTRRLAIDDDASLRLDYRVEAIERPLPFLWAAHPQFSSPVGSSVELPHGITRVVDVLDAGLPIQPWTASLAGIDTVPVGGCRKLYVEPGTPVSSAALVHVDGARATFRWTDAAPYLGIWFDNRAYSREPVIALEPATAYFDSLATAVSRGRVAWVEPAHPLQWSLAAAFSTI
jgi:galactose mutarotase-like enzyme